MPPRTSNKLTPEERVKLITIVTEMRSRGMSVPDNILQKSEAKWSVDTDGWFTKRDGTRYIPTEHQLAFINSKARFAGFFSGRGGGKSSSGAQKALKKIQQGESGAVMNPDFENMKYSTWPELREWIPWNMIAPSQRYRVNGEWQPHEPFTMSFMNGARMIVKGLKDPDSARGPNVNWLWYDEAGRDPSGLGWKIAVAGVRIGKNPQAWLTTTPKGIDHWMYKFFIKKDIPVEVIEAFRVAMAVSGQGDTPLVENFFGTINENKDNLDPAFYAQMMALYTGWLKDQELDGKFVEVGGALGHLEWFLGKVRAESLVNAKARVRYWDLAATIKKVSGKKADDPDSTVGTLLAQGDGEYLIEHQVSAQIEWHDIKKLIVDTAKLDGPTIPIRVEQEPGAGGKNQVAEIVGLAELAGFDVDGHRPEGDKAMRAMVWFSKAALGIVYLKAGEWTQTFLDQLSGFPMSEHDDKIDSVSGCFATIGKRQWKKIEFVKV